MDAKVAESLPVDAFDTLTDTFAGTGEEIFSNSPHKLLLSRPRPPTPRSSTPGSRTARGTGCALVAATASTVKKSSASQNSKLPASSNKKGKGKYTCPICSGVVKDTHEAIFCEGNCKLWFHRCCASVPSHRYSTLADSDEIFLCPSCTFLKQGDEIDALRAELSALKSEIKSLSDTVADISKTQRSYATAVTINRLNSLTISKYQACS